MAILKKDLARPNATTGKKVAYLVRVEGLRDPLTGKRRQYTRQVPTMKEARALEVQWTAEVARGTALDPAKTTVAEMLESWLTTKHGEITGQSIRDYEIIIRKHVIPALGNIPVQKLTAPRLQAQYGTWQAEHAAYEAWKATPESERGPEPDTKGLSARMIRGCHMRLSQGLRQAVRFGLVASNVCDSVNPPKLGRSKADTWNGEEAAAFLDLAITDSMHPLWHLLLLEGMRRGEALGLRWRDVNWERGTAHISQTVAPNKADRGKAMIQDRTKTLAGARSVRLTKRTIAALKEHRTAQLERRLAAPEWQDNDLIVCHPGY